MHDVKVSVTPHRINSSQGVTSEPDLLKETDSEFRDMIEQGVTAYDKAWWKWNTHEACYTNFWSDRCSLVSPCRIIELGSRTVHPQHTPMLQVPMVWSQHNLQPRTWVIHKLSSKMHPSENCTTDQMKCAAFVLPAFILRYYMASIIYGIFYIPKHDRSLKRSCTKDSFAPHSTTVFWTTLKKILFSLLSTLLIQPAL